ncbi:hypothetical protein GN244_ATG08263 [Phytophthora infestans]|uniref:Uncharacterized protein n=1 Tax=Phytophthora infestans TaxID=4787 RepID=A0A833S390_PHYIN|nr:hypothetical protein GN244_ATG08263 [Phytophthora infestans]KAF4130542.1 hypothetical protein GN958_ATG20244 [Phytophthora infestans]
MVNSDDELFKAFAVWKRMDYRKRDVAWAMLQVHRRPIDILKIVRRYNKFRKNPSIRLDDFIPTEQETYEAD